MRAKIITLILFLAMCVPFSASAVLADEIRTFEGTKAKLSLGYFLPRMNTELSVDPANPALPDGDLIDGEDDLGLDKDLSLARFDGYYRLGRKHRLQFGYFTLKRDAVRTIDRDLTFGDITFQINAQVESEFKNSITEIGYMYSLHQTDRFEVSGTFGIHWLDLQSKISGDTGGGIIETSSNSGQGPLPLIGVDLDYAFTPRWIISLRGMLFSVKIDTYDGSLTDLRGSLEYFFMNNVGVGFGINRFDMDLAYSDNDRGADFKWGYDGLQLYITARL